MYHVNGQFRISWILMRILILEFSHSQIRPETPN